MNRTSLFLSLLLLFGCESYDGPADDVVEQAVLQSEADYEWSVMGR